MQKDDWMRGKKPWQELPETKQTLQPTTLLFNRNRLFIYRINWTKCNCELLSDMWTYRQLLESQNRLKTSPVFPVKLAHMWFQRTLPANTPVFVTFPSSSVETFENNRHSLPCCHKLFFLDKAKRVLPWHVKPQEHLQSTYTQHSFLSAYYNWKLALSVTRICLPTIFAYFSRYILRPLSDTTVR